MIEQKDGRDFQIKRSIYTRWPKSLEKYQEGEFYHWHHDFIIHPRKMSLWYPTG
jgi:hypothetical protein